jgi:hypothetical protein
MACLPASAFQLLPPFPPPEGVPPGDVAFPVVEVEPLMSMRRALRLSGKGAESSRTPLSNFASMAFGSIPGGRAIERSKRP